MDPDQLNLNSVNINLKLRRLNAVESGLLTTTDKIFSDFPEIFIVVFSYLKNKRFLRKYFSSSGYQDIETVRFLECFDSVDLFFIQYLLKFVDRCSLVPGTRIC